MPGIPAQYPDPNSQAGRKISEIGDVKFKKRRAMLDTYWQYYEGNHHAPLKDAQANTIVNLCGQSVDKAVAFFCAPKAPSITVPGETADKADDSAAQVRLDAFWQATDLAMFLTNLALSGFVSGHPFVRLMQPEQAGAMPQASILDTRHVTVFWDISNIRRVLWYRLKWEVEKTSDWYRQQDIVPVWLLADEPQYDPASEWVIIEYEHRRNQSPYWKEVGRDSWAFPFAPIVEWKNLPRPNDYYGPSDLRHYKLNDQVNFVVSNTARIVKYHAHPLVTSNFKMGDITQTATGGVIEMPNDDSRMDLLEMQGDLASSMHMYELLRGAFFTQSRVVDWASHADKVGQLTNFGLRVLYGDQLDITNTKRMLYGKQGLAEISYRALWMMGTQLAERPSIQWQDPVPQDRGELVQALDTEQRLGFTSRQTLAADAGRDFEKEQIKRAKEATEAGGMLVDILGTLNDRGFGGFNAVPVGAGGRTLLA